MRRLLLTILATATAGLFGRIDALRAQPVCQGPSEVLFTSYGGSCEFFGLASLRGRHDPTTCTMFLDQASPVTCCNTFLSSQILLIGAEPIDPGQPLRVFVPGCLLSVVPVFALSRSPTPVATTWSFRLPPVSFAITFYAQGINDFFTTIGFGHDFQTTNGLRIEVR